MIAINWLPPPSRTYICICISIPRRCRFLALLHRPRPRPEQFFTHAYMHTYTYISDVWLGVPAPRFYPYIHTIQKHTLLLFFDLARRSYFYMCPPSLCVSAAYTRVEEVKKKKKEKERKKDHLVRLFMHQV